MADLVGNDMIELHEEAQTSDLTDLLLVRTFEYMLA